MELILVSFVAGVLTVLAPCVLPLLPVIVGGSTEGHSKKLQPLIITASLSISVLVFTLLIRGSTLLIDIHPDTWKYISGGIVLILGVFSVWPNLWEKINIKLGLGDESNKLLAFSAGQKGVARPILIGASLGPVFTSCSPTYAFVLATVLPQSFAEGLINIIAYVLGLGVIMLLLAYAGQKAIQKVGWAADPNGTFRRILGLIFILVGIAIITGFDKTVETAIINSGVYDEIVNIENNLRNR